MATERRPCQKQVCFREQWGIKWMRVFQGPDMAIHGWGGEISLGSPWVPPRRTIQKDNRKCLHILRGWNELHPHEGTTVRCCRGKSLSLSWKHHSGDRISSGTPYCPRAPWLIASTQTRNTFPASYFSLHLSLYLPPSYSNSMEARDSPVRG